jgi:hypothetical protein
MNTVRTVKNLQRVTSKGPFEGVVACTLLVGRSGLSEGLLLSPAFKGGVELLSASDSKTGADCGATPLYRYEWVGLKAGSAIGFGADLGPALAVVSGPCSLEAWSDGAVCRSVVSTLPEGKTTDR